MLSQWRRPCLSVDAINTMLSVDAINTMLGERFGACPCLSVLPPPPSVKVFVISAWKRAHSYRVDQGSDTERLPITRVISII